ncbi:MAG: amidohydrolase family protein [Sphingomicrobium sp.]
MDEPSRRFGFIPLLLILTAIPASALAQKVGDGGPVIDMHVHATFTERQAPVAICPGKRPLVYPAIDPVRAAKDAAVVTCDQPILSPTRRAEFESSTIAELRRNGVRRAVLIGRTKDLPWWQASAPDLFIPASVPQTFTGATLAELGSQLATGKVRVIGELGPQYQGIRADDPALDDMWALAQRYDVPVGIHLGEGVTITSEEAEQNRYQVALTSPFQLESVLHKYPRLRIYVMHSAAPLIDEMNAMLFTYPGLYVDISANDWNMPRAQFYDQLMRMVDAGFSKRILFGSDQTLWPQAIGLAIETVEQAPFLSAEQKRDILYNNAARFLRLTEAEIARDHRPLVVQKQRAEPKPRPK